MHADHLKMSFIEKQGLSLGTHLSHRLTEIGISQCFAVPGDFNLELLDQLAKNPKLEMVYCCNELNAGYAADGYARARGFACVVVTFCVGGFSALNAIAGAYSEDLPVLIVSGGPNTNDFATNRILHHTIGKPDFGQQERCFREVTCCQVVIPHLDDAHRLIDYAITQALFHKKPAYIEISCNIAGLVHPSFVDVPIPFSVAPPHSNKQGLKEALAAITGALKTAVKPVVLVGIRLRMCKAFDALMKLVESSKYAVAVMADAKGLFPESHPYYVGSYWGPVGSPGCCEIVESADIVITIGAVWTDYSTTGYSLLLKPKKVIKIDQDRVTVLGCRTFGCVAMADVLDGLAEVAPPNNAAVVNFKRMREPHGVAESPGLDEPLLTKVLFKHVQGFIDSNTAIVAEVGDTWFNSQKLSLPDGCGYEVQMRYGSIGWSVGAVLGQAFGYKAEGKRVLGIIGDGSFQMTAQEVSTLMRYNLNPVIILVNNGSYTIEVQIHDGPYNVINNWDYTGLALALDNGQGRVWTAKANTERQLEEALATAKATTDKLCFIEVFVDKDDCSKELLEWGSRVAAANSRPPAYL